MDLALFGRYFLDFALLYPSAFLCLASLWEKLRTPRRTACIAAGCITLLCIGCAALCAVFGLNSNSLLPAIVLVSFWLLRWRVTPEVTVSQTAFLFSISAVMMAVCSLLSTLLNAQTEISNPQTVCLASTALLRLGLAAMGNRRRFPGRDVVYLDADSVVRSPLKLFFDFDADLGVFIAPADAGMTHRYLTGTLYLRNTPAMHAFVEDWIAAQDGMVLGVDQDSFTTAVERHPELKVGPLPESYVKIFDRGSETPVVEHFQASRQRVKLQRTMKKARNVAIGLALVAALIWLATNG